MEDMHWSFGLAADGVPVIPLRTLDCSEVPVPFAAQMRQARRWFSGPGRAIAYVRHRGRRGPRELAVAASALLISAEWLSCAVAPFALLRSARIGPSERALVSVFTCLYAAELAVSLQALHSPGRRLIALVGFPAVNTGFGLAGWLGLSGGGFDGKTER
jgi:hypothetical protein